MGLTLRCSVVAHDALCVAVHASGQAVSKKIDQVDLTVARFVKRAATPKALSWVSIELPNLSVPDTKPYAMKQALFINEEGDVLDIHVGDVAKWHAGDIRAGHEDQPADRDLRQQSSAVLPNTASAPP